MFVSCHLSYATITCLQHFSYHGLMSGCLIMLSGSITPVSLEGLVKSPDKTEQRGSMTDCTTAIWGEAQNPVMDPHVDRCKNEHTLSQIQTLERRKLLAKQQLDLCLVKKGKVGPKRRDAVADRTWEEDSAQLGAVRKIHLTKFLKCLFLKTS